MELRLNKRGDRLSLPIPPQLAETWKLDENSIIELLETHDGLIIRKQPAAPSLDDILASIPPDFTYPEDIADFVASPPTGHEQR